MKKLVGIVLKTFGAAVVLAILLAGFLILRGENRLSHKFDLDYDETSIPSDTQSIVRGKYLVLTHACQECHTSDLGGVVMIDAPPFVVTASNLTAGTGGIGGSFSDGDWLRAIRHGVRPDGTGLMVMPSEIFYAFGDQEIGDIIAYLKTIPPVDRELPKTHIKWLGKLIAGVNSNFASSAVLVPDRPRMAMPEPGPTAAYGAYRVSTHCAGCHGQKLEGVPSPNPESPPGPSLLPYADRSLEVFAGALKTGKRANGTQLDAAFMPWPYTANMTDMDIEALYLYIQELAGKS